MRACRPRDGGAGKGRLVRLRLRLRPVLPRYRLIILCSCRSRHSCSQCSTVWSLTVLHGRQRTEPSCRRFKLWRGSAEKTRPVIEVTTPEGGPGRAVHVRRVPSRPRAHDSQCDPLPLQAERACMYNKNKIKWKNCRSRSAQGIVHITLMNHSPGLL